MANPFLPDYSDASSDIQKAQSYFAPYYQAGTRALHGYGAASAAMMLHPTGLENRIMRGYTMSPWAQYQTNVLSQTGANQAAMAGDLGTPDEQRAMEQQTQGIVSKDQQQYLHYGMQPYEEGYQGLADISHMGLSSAGQLARQEDIQEQLDRARAEDVPQLFGSVVGGLMRGGSDVAAASMFA